ncbi:2-phosphosulfolactate phosphatase [Isosphaera pallida ATCC 43644]|uniref:Probable 2-phosphosulfolactate phosphatase n=2 Tax=Isosphaera pallida TaxID=128 RepID=E8R567_ISOPI|nr:2-phosphosulfolactate phosphatase [Isosphaera pallida ATCC 43644]
MIIEFRPDFRSSQLTTMSTHPLTNSHEVPARSSSDGSAVALRVRGLATSECVGRGTVLDLAGLQAETKTTRVWAVVFDVLRATTVIVRAIESGALGVRPCLTIDQARAVATAQPSSSRVLGGERGGKAIDGFDLGNSPAEYTPERCRGRLVVLTTTNGTRALEAAAGAERVFVAAFVNLAATARHLVACLERELQAAPIRDSWAPPLLLLVPAGTDGRVSQEDVLAAGGLIAALQDQVQAAEPARPPRLRFTCDDDETLLAHLAWRAVAAERQTAATATDRDAILAERLKWGRGGRNLLDLGFGRDLEDCARVDSLPRVVARDPNSGLLVAEESDSPPSVA